MNLRAGFSNISSGWMLISGVDDLTDRIEQLAEWAKANAPLNPDEELTVKFMIECQIARMGHFGDSDGYPTSDWEDEFNE